MGQSAGAGSPVYFMCPKERVERNHARILRYTPRAHAQVRTGRERPYKSQAYSALGVRSDKVSREYVCDCGHKGWSNHIDLKRLSLEGDA